MLIYANLCNSYYILPRPQTLVATLYGIQNTYFQIAV